MIFQLASANESSVMSEFIYILENLSMPGLVKIGRTERSVSERVSELSSHTGVPTGFTVVREYAVANSVEAERKIHERLSDYRIANNREFFKMEAEDAADIIESMLETVKPETRRDFEREDDLVAKAIPIVVKLGAARPRMLEEKLAISYEEALGLIHILRGRGVIGPQNESRWTASSSPQGVSQNPKPSAATATPLIGNYYLPPMDFLQHADSTIKPPVTKDELMTNARLIQATLAQKEIEVSLGDITRGPTITRYELHVAPGIQLEEISKFATDLKDALKTERINILAPIPSKSTVGVDVPNAIRTKVIMRELFESEQWINSRARIPIALGKDVSGHVVIADLGDLPHLLMGGDSGSGKSVCLNAIIVSLLYRFSPDQLRFVMIDSGGIDLQQYNGLAHHVLPVVSDNQKAILALRWVVNEMEKRFQVFMRVGVTRIGSFNSRPPKSTDLHQNDIVFPDKLSCVVVVIENLEDLIQAARPDVEAALEYIVQNGRAAGIHLVLSMRQASQNAISEKIKTEIPARIAFRCGSRIESRSIIGEAGAEKLLGKGDMLFLAPSSANLIRAQGALITDSEIQTCVDFIAAQGKPSYEPEIYKKISKPATAGIESGIDEDEETIHESIEIIRNERKASVSVLQRRQSLGYTRAARIMDELECRGIVGPSKGAEPRDILIDLNTDEFKATVEQPPVIQPQLIVCACKHCEGNIEFDANELGDRQNVSVSCPHCRLETVLSHPG